MQGLTPEAGVIVLDPPVRVRRGRYERFVLCASCSRGRWMAIEKSSCAPCAARIAATARIRGLLALGSGTLFGALCGLLWASQSSFLSLSGYGFGLCCFWGFGKLLSGRVQRRR